MQDILRFFTAYVEGESQHLDIEEAQIPAIADAVESYRGGGMWSELDVAHGLEKLEASFALTSIAQKIMVLAGLAPGKVREITFRGSLASEIDGSTKDVLATVRGRINQKPKAWQAGGKTGVEYPIGSITYYKLIIGGELVDEYDLVNMSLIVDGEDQLKEHRSNLGLF